MSHDPADADLRLLIEAFAAAESWSESRDLVLEHPRLLSARADAMLAEYPPVYREVLARARHVGVRQAFDEVSTQGVPEGLRTLCLAAIRAREAAEVSGDEGERDEVVRLFSRLVSDPRFAEATPHMRATMNYVLGLAAVERFYVRDAPEDLDLAVAAFAASADVVPEPDHLTALGNVHGLRYERGGETADLLAAIAAGRRATAAQGGGDASVAWHDLAVNLGIWYELEGSPETLDEAVVIATRATRADADPELLSAFLSTLANCLIIRYEHRGALADLHAAIDTARRAIDLDDGGPESATLHASLGGLLHLRFARDRRAATLAEAALVLEQASAALAPGSLPAAICLGQLGNVHLSRFENGEDALPAARDAFQRAVAGCPLGSPHSAHLWNGFGLALLHSGELDAAMTAFGRAGTDDPLARGNLATAHRLRHDALGDPADIEAGRAHFTFAVHRALVRQPEIALDVGSRWGRWAIARRSWPEAARAYRGAVVAARRLFLAQHERGAWTSWLLTEGDLAAQAAYAFVRADAENGDEAAESDRVEHAGGAVEAVVVLEGGRARVSEEALNDPARLRARLGSLADRYALASRRARAAENGNTGVP
ncbi:hypothetical protein GCM10009850_118990 [Nonomuraea monospora]|uniref:Tetratricopeptide repeat protein n=1 Tax=Nonomuraea monospora TaxID=568818 RepID=A0ABP5PXG8_9ACTN